MLAIEHPEVAKASRYIQANFPRKDLLVSSVVEACNLSRRFLEKAFRRELDRSILAEILRIRVNHARTRWNPRTCPLLLWR